MFDFSSSETTVAGASMCLAFLHDHPLQIIRRVHLSSGEPLHYQDSRLMPSPLSPLWGQLYTKLSRKLSLHQLILSVDGRSSKICPVDPGNGGVQIWVQEICKITNMQASSGRDQQARIRRRIRSNQLSASQNANERVKFGDVGV